MKNDLISKQAAIDAVNELRKSPWFNNPQNVYRTEAVDIVERLCIKELPSAQPELSEYSDKLWKKAYERGKAEAQQRWIPCSERLPEEEDSIFARYYGTDRWRKAMFRKKSREVIVTSVFEDGELHTEVAHTTDGKWCVGVNVVPRTVIAWMPLPEPYEEKDNERA